MDQPGVIRAANLGGPFLFDLDSGRHPEGQMKELQFMEDQPVAEASSLWLGWEWGSQSTVVCEQKAQTWGTLVSPL